MTPLLMEEHHDALFAWKRLGLTAAWCWHVDAHLDIGREGMSFERMAALAACRSAEDARSRKAMGSCYLPWGGLNCGNYLYPAIRQGVISRLSWIVPPYLPSRDVLAWARSHLNSWFDIPLEDSATLEAVDGRVQGQLLGIPFEVGCLDALQTPKQPVLLDIDLDFFLTEHGEVWSGAPAQASQIAAVPSLCTTVAFSVKGGFTPTVQRSLAIPFAEGQPTEGWRANDLDQAAALVRRHQYGEALPRLSDLVASHPVEARYYTGTCLQALERKQEALAVWSELARDPLLPVDGAAYLGRLCGEICLKIGNPECALGYALEVKRLAPADYRAWWMEAAAREGMGDLKAATKLVRRALNLAENISFSLNMRLALARLYRRQGKRELAKAELRRLSAADVTGQYKAASMLL